MMVADRAQRVGAVEAFQIDVILGADEDLPLLPEASIMLIRNLNNPSPITECLAEHIVEGFKL